MARIYYDKDGKPAGSSKSTMPGQIWGFICTMILLALIFGAFAH